MPSIVNKPIMLSVVMLNVVTLSVIMLNVIMLSIVAQTQTTQIFVWSDEEKLFKIDTPIGFENWKKINYKKLAY
jgi:hypothetical protein